MEQKKKRLRRWHPADFKAQAVAACQVPGASLAGVALEFRLNANLLRRWVKESVAGTALVTDAEVAAPQPGPSFVPIGISAAKSPAQTERPIRVQVRKRGLRLTIEWPASAAAVCAGWLQELLG